ncbi:hypothetical protein BV898_11096 [Hypsibius exemplaris]|uniref:Reverse transcriptase domain-containing protein n=1 Tax=Hypsibius exemplaris TaxID=2072580 RepID=A0A1W0WHP4_HYPEX|nr:hypothetical protein BV898_11096 [Hypsibius exemplaris]
MDNGGVTAVAFLDLRKAFDSVCHTTLLHKLQAVGVDHTALAWFHSYLTDRCKRVQTEAGLSDLLPTTSGVPQGTVLGPLPFSLYVNEMLLISPADLENCEAECFADDTTVEASGKTAEEVVVRLNASLHRISTELASLRLPTNAAKTKWDEQFKAIQRNATFGIAKFNRAKGGLSIQQRVSLYHALIQPHFDFCCVVWSAAKSTLRKKVATTQRKAIRALTNYQEHVTPELFARLGISHVFERWRQKEAVWLYQIISTKSKIPPYMRDLVVIKDLSSIYNLRRPKRVEAETSKTKAMITQQSGGHFCMDLSAISILRIAGEDYLRAMGFVNVDARALLRKYRGKRRKPAQDLPSQGSGDTAPKA